MSHRAGGKPIVLNETAEQRFWPKVGPPESGGCRRWTGYLNPRTGYGQFNLGNQSTGLAHRVAYTLACGVIPDGMQLDHLCRNRWCVNPEHLEPVTATENARRGDAGLNQRSKTHCPKGHPYDEANTYLYPAGFRRCRTCAREHDRKYRRGKRAVPQQ